MRRIKKGAIVEQTRIGGNLGDEEANVGDMHEIIKYNPESLYNTPIYLTKNLRTGEQCILAEHNFKPYKINIKKGGKQIPSDKYFFDVKTKTVICYEDGVIIDLRDEDEFNFILGENCKLKAGNFCNVICGRKCNISVGYNGSVKNGYYCKIKTGDNTTISSGGNCDIETGSNSILNIGFECNIKSEYGTTVKEKDEYDIFQFKKEMEIKTKHYKDNGPVFIFN